jgi:hypothetical protein
MMYDLGFCEIVKPQRKKAVHGNLKTPSGSG